MKLKKNIAILGSHFTWDGGVDFLCFLVNSLIKNKESGDIFLFLPYNSIAKAKRIILQSQKLLSKPALLKEKKNYKIDNDNKRIILAFNNLTFEYKIIYYNYTRLGLAAKLKEIDADVVLPAVRSLGTSFPVPWVGYIPDLQHKYFPEFFSPKEVRKRDTLFSNLIKDGKAIIVNSQAVKNDIKIHYQSNDNVFSLPFTPPAPPKDFFNYKKQTIVNKYNLPEKFFIVSNQFWKHKSHITAFEALAKLHQDKKYQDVAIVCTGKLQDYRFPEFIEFLHKSIKILGIEEKVIFLGFIPKTDQLLVMDKALALIQPTLFEGGPGGGSVYNAVSIGLPVIISDIETNKEIEEENIYFFKAGSSDDLASKMAKILNEKIKRKNQELLLLKGHQRTEELCKVLMQVIDYASGK